MAWHNNNIDDQHLFRLCSTFGWDDAISLCNSLVLGIEKSATDDKQNSSSSRFDGDDGGLSLDHFSYYNDSILDSQTRGKKSLDEWLQNAHTQLFYIDPWGNCPLHAASYVKPPLNVIEALFRLGRALWKHGSGYREQIPLWGLPCRDSSTPFLVASSTGASTAVLHCYLDEIEYYIEQAGWVEHPKLARMLVVQSDNQGTTPLSGWMHFHDQWIKCQLEKENGMNHIESETNSHRFIPRQSMEQASSQSHFWELACRMLRFATMNIHPHTPISTPVLVHRCADIAVYCPPSLLDWVVAPRTNDRAWIPADISAATTDSTGRLPLHRALESLSVFSMFDEEIVYHGSDFDADTTLIEPETIAAQTIAAVEMVTTRSEAIIYNNPKREKNRVQIMNKLLKWHSDAATTPFPNGRWPFIQAIAHGGTWHLIGGDGNDVGILQLLWNHAPEQSSEVDDISGLYPFMLAATIPTPGKMCSHSINVVDNVYNLLRKDPQLVAGALSDNG